MLERARRQRFGEGQHGLGKFFREFREARIVRGHGGLAVGVLLRVEDEDVFAVLREFLIELLHRRRNVERGAAVISSRNREPAWFHVFISCCLNGTSLGNENGHVNIYDQKSNSFM